MSGFGNIAAYTAGKYFYMPLLTSLRGSYTKRGHTRRLGDAPHYRGISPHYRGISPVPWREERDIIPVPEQLCRGESFNLSVLPLAHNLLLLLV